MVLLNLIGRFLVKSRINHGNIKKKTILYKDFFLIYLNIYVRFPLLSKESSSNNSIQSYIFHFNNKYIEVHCKVSSTNINAPHHTKNINLKSITSTQSMWCSDENVDLYLHHGFYFEEATKLKCSASLNDRKID